MEHIFSHFQFLDVFSKFCFIIFLNQFFKQNENRKSEIKKSVFSGAHFQKKFFFEFLNRTV